MLNYQSTTSSQGYHVRGFRAIFLGFLALALSIPVAVCCHIINSIFSAQPEKAVMIILILFVFILGLTVLIYLVRRRALSEPSELAMILLAVGAILLVGIYMYRVSVLIRLPADILIWSESDFVNDILKYRVGYPLFTDQVNNDSFTYVPGPQLLTYFLAWLLRQPVSIPVYRIIQVGYTAIAAMIAFLCGGIILRISSPQTEHAKWKLWSAIWLPILFLIATNSLTNPFVHALHDDSLAQLYSVFAYYILLAYIYTRNRRYQLIMILVPAVGFIIKQSLTAWAFFYLFHITFFDRPFSLKKTAVFALSSFGFIGVVIAGCYLVWGDPFIYWTFTVLGKHGVSLLRSFQHMLDVWIFLVLGLLGGVALLVEKNIRKLLSPWLIWLGLIMLEIYTSGIAWMTNHIGPGSLLSGIWFLAGLVTIWPSVVKANFSGNSRIFSWFRAALILAILSLLFSGIGAFRIPIPPLPEDAYRYIRDIESQFNGHPAENVLLDAGSWVYINENVIMKDRAPSIGERGYSETGDFSGILQRLQERQYSKILVRNFDTEIFWYDHFLWDKSSGIREAMLENYELVGKIPSVEGVDNYLFDEVSILVPKSP